MFREFAAVYLRHIDLPDHGQRATPANERRFTNEQLAGTRVRHWHVPRVVA